MLINHLYNENCLETIGRMKRLKEPPVDMVITSPPYGSLREYEGYGFDFEAIAQGLFDVMKDGAVLVWIVGDQVKDGSESLQSFKQAIFFVDQVGFKLNDTMIYKKIGGLPNNDGCRYEQEFEYAFCFSKGMPKTFNPIMKYNKWFGIKNKENSGNVGTSKDKKTKHSAMKERTVKEKSPIGNVWEYGVGFKKSTTDDISFQHPAIFPEKLAADHIRSWSNPGDLIFEPMAGSGTVIKAAISLNRDWVASEISTKYCNEVIKPRLSRLLIQREEKEIS